MYLIPSYLKPLEVIVRPFPMEAVQEAVERKEETIPHLLGVLEWALEEPMELIEAEPPYMLHIYAMYLLGEFREKRAFPVLLRFFRSEYAEEMTGDIVADDLGRMLASTYNGDIKALHALIEDTSVEEFTRSAGITALGGLLLSGTLSRSEVSSYLGELFGGRLTEDTEVVWEMAADLARLLRMTEHTAAIESAFDAGLIDPTYIAPAQLLADIQKPFSSDDPELEQYDLIESAVDELADWYCFTKEAELEDKLAYEDDDDLIGFSEPVEPGVPVTRVEPKVGRNDKCPCGSGKKYKKCCGALAQ